MFDESVFLYLFVFIYYYFHLERDFNSDIHICHDEISNPKGRFWWLIDFYATYVARIRVNPRGRLGIRGSKQPFVVGFSTTHV